MNSRSLGIFVLVLATLMFAGCRTAPVYNVTDAPVEATEGTPTMQQVEKAIMTAGRQLGWEMKSKEPGLIVATLHLRTHVAVVAIHYDTEKYSITYTDSTNLRYDGTNIHKNYNGWIQNLSNAIQVQIGAI